MPDDSPPTIGSVFTLRPDAALEVLDRRATLRTSTYWSEVYADEHAGAFTAAKIAKLDIARTLFDGLRRALEEGRTPEMFIKDVRPSLERAGWWGVVEDASLTGTSDAVAITPSRLRRIYDTNMRGSRAAALWARFQDGKAEAIPALFGGDGPSYAAGAPRLAWHDPAGRSPVVGKPLSAERLELPLHRHLAQSARPRSPGLESERAAAAGRARPGLSQARAGRLGAGAGGSARH